jgi:hypothetical protein
MIHHGILTYNSENKKFNCHFSADHLFFRNGGEYNWKTVIYWLKFISYEDGDDLNQCLFICDDEGREKEMIWKSRLYDPKDINSNWFFNENFSYTKNYFVINQLFIEEFLKFAKSKETTNMSSNHDFINYDGLEQFISINGLFKFDEIKKLFPTRVIDTTLFWKKINANEILNPNHLKSFVNSKNYFDLPWDFSMTKNNLQLTAYFVTLAQSYLELSTDEQLKTIVEEFREEYPEELDDSIKNQFRLKLLGKTINDMVTHNLYNMKSL